MKRFTIFIICLIMLFLFISCETNEEFKKQNEQYQIYLLAQDAGFSGTYEEWLASIKGDKGDPGEQGTQGDKGDPGEIGKSAYDIFLEYYPDYKGTEEEWITSVAKGEICKLFGHKWDNGNTEAYLGRIEYICTTCKEVKKIENVTPPISVNIIGDNFVYVGYTIQLQCRVMPVYAINTVKWSVINDEIGTIDENGLFTALKPGKVIVKATSTEDSQISCTYQITIEEPAVEAYPNMGGYEIVIMSSQSTLADVDPFLDGYSEADKNYKQKAWSEVENNYNCKISVKSFPESLPWYSSIDKIKDAAACNAPLSDLALISSYWIPDLAKSNILVDVKEYYNRYGLNQMETYLKEAGTYNGGLYTVSKGMSPTNIYVDLGLFYDLTWMQSLGVEDPAQMFLDGRWNYSGFKKWVLETQTKLNDGEFVFGGHPYYYYYGMTNAARIKIADSSLISTKISSQRSKDACDLIYSLVEAGCCDKVPSWAESDGGFIEGTTLMSTGYLWFVRNDSRWKIDMFGNDTRYGYVPFPYPDDVAKVDTRIGHSISTVLVCLAGRQYPEGISTKEVYRAVNEMFLNTVKYQKDDPNFDADEAKRKFLKTKIDNEASIEAILYYDVSKVFFDPAHKIFTSISATCLKQPSINVMYNGADFYNEFELVEEEFYNRFMEFYG